jgi:MFS transporter, SP family, sugar:H+ symporter
MTLFVALFLPETKGVPIEYMVAVWEKHWYWKRFVLSDDGEGGKDVEKADTKD